jgi:outer membrane protein TolC
MVLVMSKEGHAMRLQGRPEIRLTWAVMVCLSVGSVRAQEASQPLTMRQCIDIALQNQPAIQARQEGVGIAAEQQKIARSYFFPQVDAGTRFTQLNKHVFVDFPNPISGPVADLFGDSAAFFGIARKAGSNAALFALNHPSQPPFSTARQAAINSLPSNLQVDLLGDRFLTTNVFVTQPLYTGGKLRYHNQQAKLGIDAAGSEVEQARQQTAFEVSKAYLSILLARELVKVAMDSRGEFAAVESLARVALDRGKNDFVTAADVTRAGSLKLLAESQKVEFGYAAERAQAGLRTAMGLEVPAVVAIADSTLPRQFPKLELAPLVDLALARRPEIIRAQLALRKAELDRKRAVAQFHPDVVAYGRFTSIQDDASFPNPTNPNEWAAGFEARVNLFSGGRRFAEKRKADHEIAEASEAVRLVRQRVTLEVEQAYLQYKETFSRIPLAEEARKEAVTALDVYGKVLQLRTKAEKHELPKDFENLLTTRLLLSQAEVSYLEQVYACNLALAVLRLTTASGAYENEFSNAAKP